MLHSRCSRRKTPSTSTGPIYKNLVRNYLLLAMASRCSGGRVSAVTRQRPRKVPVTCRGCGLRRARKVASPQLPMMAVGFRQPGAEELEHENVSSRGEHPNSGGGCLRIVWDNRRPGEGDDLPFAVPPGETRAAEVPDRRRGSQRLDDRASAGTREEVHRRHGRAGGPRGVQTAGRSDVIRPGRFRGRRHL